MKIRLRFTAAWRDIKQAMYGLRGVTGLPFIRGVGDLHRHARWHYGGWSSTFSNLRRAIKSFIRPEPWINDSYFTEEPKPELDEFFAPAVKGWNPHEGEDWREE